MNSTVILNKVIDDKTSKLTMLVGRTLVGKTTLMLDFFKDAIRKNIPTLFFSLELSKQQVIDKIVTVKEDKMFINNTNYIEDIYSKSKKLKHDADIQLILIDSITELKIKENICLGRGDIVSIMIKQLKELAQELDVQIVVTAPANITTKQFKNDPTKTLSYFCKKETAKDYVDTIVLLERDKKNNQIMLFEQHLTNRPIREVLEQL